MSVAPKCSDGLIEEKDAALLAQSKELLDCLGGGRVQAFSATNP
jgi:hypothetical protein